LIASIKPGARHRDVTIDQRSSSVVYQQSLPEQVLVRLGWGRTPVQRLLDAARRLATDVHTREAAELARLVGDSGDTRPAEVQFTQPALLYWRTDGGFASDTKAFHVQPNPGSGANPPCSDDRTTWTFYTFAGWQGIGEDLQSVVQNPGFNNPTYPADDFSLPHGSPGVGFVVFDPSQAGRTNPVLKPPAVAPTFPVKLYNPATDY